MSDADQKTIASLRQDGLTIIAVGAAMAAVAGTSVLLRFVAKARSHAPLGMDDLLITLSLAVFATVEGLVLRAVIVGRNATTGKDPVFTTFKLLTYIYSLMYWTIIASATSSLLFLFRRIFFANTKFRNISGMVILLVACWWISGTCADALAWQPTRSYWDTSISGQYTIQYNDFWLTSMIIEMLFETTTLILPIRQVVKLNLSLPRKLLVATMFLMGGLVLISGIVRIYYAWAQEDMTPGVIWLSVHCAVAIVSACLPTYRALFPAKKLADSASLSTGATRTMTNTQTHSQMQSHTKSHIKSQGLSTHNSTKGAGEKAPEWPLPNDGLDARPRDHTDLEAGIAPKKSVDSLFSSNEPLTALPPVALRPSALPTKPATSSPPTLPQPRPARRTLFAEVDRGLKQLRGRPESRFEWRRSKI